MDQDVARAVLAVLPALFAPVAVKVISRAQQCLVTSAKVSN